MKTSQTVTVGSIRTISEAGYQAPAYRPARYEIGERWSEDFTDENPSAHGNIVRTEEESSEGRQRRVAINGSHREVGPWSPTRAQREAHERAEAAKARAAQEAVEDKAAKDAGVSVVRVSGESVECIVRGERKTTPLRAIREAAADPYNPRLTTEMALKMESAEDRATRLVYRSMLRKALAIAPK